MPRRRLALAATAAILAATVALTLGGRFLPAGGSARAQSEPTLEWKIGQMLMGGVRGTAVTDDAVHLIRDLQVGNVVIMGDNVDEPGQVLALTTGLQELALDANGVGLLISTDQEGGLVQRLHYGFTRLPDAGIVGSSRRPDLIRRYGEVVGSELAAVGINLDLAPVLDVNDNPANPVIGPRSFGSTPDLVLSAGPAFINGLHDAGVIATGKHFPGHGNTSTDSHLTVPFVLKERAELEAVELAPFREAIRQGLDAVMIAHVVYPAFDPSELPATVSPPIVTGVLREELGFAGVITTDDMGMKGITALFDPEEAAVRAVLAGADIVLCARLAEDSGACTPAMLERHRAGLLEAVRDGRIPVERIDASVDRILALKARYRVGPPTGEGMARVGGAANLRVVADIMEAAGRP